MKCSECYPRTLAGRLQWLPDVQAAEIQTVVLRDVLGVAQAPLSASAADARERRLDANVRVLYHQTSAESWAKISASRRMEVGRGGLAGAGIYFAETASDTQHKALSKGVIITARVRLGNNLRLPWSGDPSVTLKGLLIQGYDSVSIPRTGTEWVVYCYDQVEIIKGTPC
jgi:hypothetical protein